jgi:hypothetical protein
MRPGTVGEAVFSGILGVSTGKNIPLLNSSFAVIPAISFLYTATSTVGNRQIIIQILDPSSRILWQCPAQALITASQAPRLFAGAATPLASVTLPLMQTMALPVEMPVPTFSSVQIFDLANQDVNDTAAGVVVFAM